MRKTYATLDNDIGGADYRTVAMMMTRDGEIMGHSTVRNVILRVMERFSMALMAKYGVWGHPAEKARDPDFQKAIAALVQEAYVCRRTFRQLPN